MGGPYNQPIQVNVLLDGKPIAHQGGKDVHNSVLVLNEHRLYEIANLSKSFGGNITLQFDRPSAQIYTFTFGE